MARKREATPAENLAHVTELMKAIDERRDALSNEWVKLRQKHNRLAVECLSDDTMLTSLNWKLRVTIKKDWALVFVSLRAENPSYGVADRLGLGHHGDVQLPTGARLGNDDGELYISGSDDQILETMRLYNLRPEPDPESLAKIKALRTAADLLEHALKTNVPS
jgi:hypothetical protein